MFKFFNFSVIRPRLSVGLCRSLTEALAGGEVTLYLWKPFPERVVGLNNKPLWGYMSGGATGHLSMEVRYSSGEKSYISIWPGELPIHPDRPNDKPSEPIKRSMSLENDIEAEMSRVPHKKTIWINHETAQRLKNSIEKLEKELEKDPRDREQWSLTNNCATYIATLLYDSGINNNTPTVLETPNFVFEMTDPVEQAIYLENSRTFSYKG